jgi:hypothetical protein
MREISTARIALSDDGVLIVRIRDGARQRRGDEARAVNWLKGYLE